MKDASYTDEPSAITPRSPSSPSHPFARPASGAPDRRSLSLPASSATKRSSIQWAEDICRQIRPIDGLVTGPKGLQGLWQVMMEVTLLEPGTLRFDGFEVSYRQGVRRGKQVTGSGRGFFTQGFDADR